MGPIYLLSSVLAGGVASIAGFGIGSILTPTVAASHPATIAVAIVAIPHFFATVVRFWMLRRDVDWSLMRSFGVMSAVGGLIGAWVGVYTQSRVLEVVLAVLLIFVGLGGLMGMTQKLRFDGIWAWLSGVASGFLGGLVGNQGGLRAGAMTGFGITGKAFVATSTAAGVIVDIARLPVYLAVYSDAIIDQWKLVAGLTAGTLVGTWLGIAVLRRIPERAFMVVVRLLLLGLGIYLTLKG